ncbi:MAG: HAD family hydrolase [Thermaurantiacus sp.]
MIEPTVPGISRRSVMMAASVVAAATALPANAVPQAARLSSWNPTATRDRITSFVERITREGDPDFVPAEQRIATFDNDGTLWSEMPLPFQAFFMLDLLKARAKDRPQWATEEPYASAMKGDLKGVAAQGAEELEKLLFGIVDGVSAEDYARDAASWLQTARHPTTGRRFRDMVYQPMLELIAYLRAHAFRIFIVTGGETEFVRALGVHAYGILPEQALGSLGPTQFENRPSGSVVVKRAGLDFRGDGPGKPVSIQRHIGQRPLIAIGNADGDVPMLQYAADATGPRLTGLVHHTDSVREFAYDREGGHGGRLDVGLDEAKRRDWMLIDMARDWRTVFPG